tara:strand:+ start:69 stop:707 length:639 start_codon:yes stop_codon:yes gene_type:complete
MEENIVVYQHKIKNTKEVFYIGIGVPNRPYRKDRRNKWWNNIVNKYDYDIEVLHTNLTWDEACKKEIYLIKYYGRKDLGLGTLVNLTDGGDGTFGMVHSNITKQKMSSSKKGMFYETDNPFFGKKHTKETKKILSEKAKNKVYTQETLKKFKVNSTGQTNGNAKLKKEDVLWIRKNYKPRDKEYGRNALSKKFNLNVATIHKIISKELWKHI